MSHCKKVHQNDYKSDDELDFVPVVSSNANDETTKEEVVEIVFVTSSKEDDKTTDNL